MATDFLSTDKSGFKAPADSPLALGVRLLQQFSTIQGRAREAWNAAEIAQRRLADIEASTSWRLTAPLRWLVHTWQGSSTSRRWQAPDVGTCEAPLPHPALAATTPPAAEEGKKQRHRRACTEALDAFLTGSKRLALPEAAEPRVSVLIVLHNQAELTFHCLQSLARLVSTETEVILLDNASTDRTGAMLERIDGGHIIRSTENLHFLRGVNRAAANARGRHLLLLNNDTAVTPGAIEAAAGRLDAEPDLGAVGGPILCLDGSLQEAGCIIWRDGHGEGYGRGQDPDAPEFAFRRDVDYCSGAFLMVRRDVFEALGGLDEAFAPAYFEEADLCMRIRAAGLRVGYEPAARIIHFEYGSIGSQASAKPLYARNHLTFVERHSSALRSAHRDRAEGILAARARTAHPGAVLILDSGEVLGEGEASPFRDTLAALRAAGVALTYCRLATRDRPGFEPDALGRAGIETFRPATAAELRILLAARSDYHTLVIISGCGEAPLMEATLAYVRHLPPKIACIWLNRRAA